MTDRYAVFGNPLSHSKSPLIHMTFARDTGADIDYGRVEAPLDGFAASVEAFRAAGGRGINITAPFKLDAYALATRRMPRAECAGATNCLKFENNEIIAENFDGIGLVRDIERNLRMPLAGKRVLLLGAGGAARGALLPILEALPSILTIVNRTRAKADAMQCQFARFGAIHVANGDEVGPRSFDVVLNATSASLRGELPAFAAESIAPGALAYELAYGKGLTPFLTFTRSAGAGPLADGVGMLVEQAAEAFAWWRGTRPRTRSLIDDLTIPLE
ncbi:shikimate dehydrogenase [Bradyrhizobium tropiciagri]|uniref:shikimate dehydrogenase n=1 Tax=Bradyrhizobium tropiciagri TaxID=312253 RepID=UPI001BA71A42|nr:shikimate dehydrogenase [Bradyrhizobium tropiciagri]MBR0898851.1 shikimate dehydrogenase [Bradyrhizobium tropiciagri]